jgi:hypothetical protein
MFVDHLTEHGVMKPELRYISPFKDITPQGQPEKQERPKIARIGSLRGHLLEVKFSS